MPFAAVFRLRCMFVLSFVFGTLAAVFFRFRLHSLFVSRNFCVKHYASFWIFMQSKNVYLYNIMINRKLWNFYKFSEPLRKSPIFLLFVFSLFLLFWYFRLKRKQKLKIRFFCRFCLNMSVFVANKVLVFSDLRLYRANHTPPPRFWHSQGGSALFRKFFIFFIFYFL